MTDRPMADVGALIIDAEDRTGRVVELRADGVLVAESASGERFETRLTDTILWRAAPGVTEAAGPWYWHMGWHRMVRAEESPRDHKGMFTDHGRKHATMMGEDPHDHDLSKDPHVGDSDEEDDTGGEEPPGQEDDNDENEIAKKRRSYEAATHPPPYNWRHGWKPLNPHVAKTYHHKWPPKGGVPKGGANGAPGAAKPGKGKGPAPHALTPTHGGVKGKKYTAPKSVKTAAHGPVKDVKSEPTAPKQPDMPAWEKELLQLDEPLGGTFDANGNSLNLDDKVIVDDETPGTLVGLSGDLKNAKVEFSDGSVEEVSIQDIKAVPSAPAKPKKPSSKDMVSSNPEMTVHQGEINWDVVAANADFGKVDNSMSVPEYKGGGQIKTGDSVQLLGGSATAKIVAINQSFDGGSHDLTIEFPNGSKDVVGPEHIKKIDVPTLVSVHSAKVGDTVTMISKTSGKADDFTVELISYHNGFTLKDKHGFVLSDVAPEKIKAINGVPVKERGPKLTPVAGGLHELQTPGKISVSDMVTVNMGDGIMFKGEVTHHSAGSAYYKVKSPGGTDVLVHKSEIVNNPEIAAKLKAKGSYKTITKDKLSVNDTVTDKSGNSYEIIGLAESSPGTLEVMSKETGKPGLLNVDNIAEHNGTPVKVAVTKPKAKVTNFSEDMSGGQGLKDEHGNTIGLSAYNVVPRAADLNLEYDEKTALSAYTGSAYQTINGGLRSYGLDPNELSDSTLKRIMALDQIFQKAEPLSESIGVVRGVSNSDQLFGPVGSKVGKTFHDAGYVSTTTKIKGVGFGEESNQGAQLEITLPPGTKAVRPNGHGVYGDSEGEVLLPRGSRFKVVDDYTNHQNRRIIRLELIVP